MDFEDLSILSWNIRGALSLEGRRHAKELVRKHRPLFIFLMETHFLSQKHQYFGTVWVMRYVLSLKRPIIREVFGC